MNKIQLMSAAIAACYGTAIPDESDKQLAEIFPSTKPKTPHDLAALERAQAKRERRAKLKELQVLHSTLVNPSYK